MSLFQETPSKRSSNSNRRTISNDNNQNVEYDSYILKENNEMPFGYNDSDWNDSPDIECPEKLISKGANDDYITINDVYDANEVNDEQFDPSIQSHRRFVQHSEINELNTTGESVTVNNNVHIPKKAQKATETHQAPRLPLTPKRIRGGQAPTVKKILPTVHRVLLYNSQSPRLARKHQSSNSRSQNVKLQHPKGHGHNHASDQTIHKYILEEPDVKDNEYREADFDNDDDLDNSEYYLTIF